MVYLGLLGFTVPNVTQNLSKPTKILTPDCQHLSSFDTKTSSDKNRKSFKMADYDSDSSVGEDIETGVTLGYATKDATGDDFSQLGGHPVS